MPRSSNGAKLGRLDDAENFKLFYCYYQKSKMLKSQLKIVAYFIVEWYIINKRGNMHMNNKEKLIERLLSRPKDFTYEEMVTLLSYLDFHPQQGNGSRVKFIKENKDDNTSSVIHYHKPHPNKILKMYVLEQIIVKLREDSLL